MKLAPLVISFKKKLSGIGASEKVRQGVASLAAGSALVASNASAALPTEFDVAAPMLLIVGYVFSAGAAGLGVFFAFRTVAAIAKALRLMMK